MLDSVCQALIAARLDSSLGQPPWLRRLLRLLLIALLLVALLLVALLLIRLLLVAMLLLLMACGENVNHDMTEPRGG